MVSLINDVFALEYALKVTAQAYSSLIIQTFMRRGEEVSVLAVGFGATPRIPAPAHIPLESLTSVTKLIGGESWIKDYFTFR